MKRFPQKVQCFVIGTIAAMILLILGSWALATILIKGIVAYESLKYYILIVVILSTAIGTVLIHKGTNGIGLKMCMLYAGILWVILLSLNALLLDGVYSGVGETLMLLLGSSVATTLLTMRLRKCNRKTYYRKRDR